VATVREVELSDVEAVSILTESVGWGRVTLEGWDRLWRRNPAAAGGAFARGWILEDRGRIVGYLCNVGRLYRHGCAILRAASASSLVVLPEFRGQSLQLFLQYARQGGVDLLLNTTAAPNVSKISEFLKFEPIPQPDYDVSFYWVLRSRPFATSALRKKQVPPPWDGWVGRALAPAVWVYAGARHRLRQRTPEGASISVIPPSGIDGGFDEMWERVAAKGDRLLAYRTSGALRWHFPPRSDARWPFLVVARGAGRLLGYVAVVRQDAGHLGLGRARFADVFVEGDEPAIVRALMGRAIEEAARRGVAMIELIGFPEPVRAAARALRPFELRSESWPFVYRARTPELQQALGPKDVWYASLFDGDGSL